jgi:hypothetical protein
MNTSIKLRLQYTRLIGSLLIAAFLLILFLTPFQYAHAVKSTCDFQHRECFTEAGYPACYKKIDIEKYYQFVGENKLELAEQIVMDDKKCVKLTGNQKAFMQDKSGSYVKFGIRGRNVTFWAKREALFAR